MSDVSAILSLPYIQPAQAQKHVTHNEALQILDRLVQLAVADRDRATPPASPAEGDCHIVASGATGAWAGQEHAIATYDSGLWQFLAPKTGWRAYVVDEAITLTWQGSAWSDGGDAPVSANRLGVNASADATNRLAVSSDAVLLTHAGGDHQLKINKASASDTASLLFQSNWSGRAEIGIAGSDSFALKVSGDGAAWTTALSFAPTTGIASGAAVQATVLDDTAGRLMATGAFGLGDGATGAAAPSDDADACLAAGFYSFTASGSNTPVADPSGGSLIVARTADGTARQLFLGDDGSRIWMRGQVSGSWTPWSALFTQASVVDTVSESGGTPTGGVVESGSNANGEYIRWADGTQFCTNSDAAITTDPASFAGTVTSIDGGKLKIGRWF